MDVMTTCPCCDQTVPWGEDDREPWLCPQCAAKNARIAELEAGISDTIDDLAFDIDSGDVTPTIARLHVLLVPKEE